MWYLALGVEWGEVRARACGGRKSWSVGEGAKERCRRNRDEGKERQAVRGPRRAHEKRLRSRFLFGASTARHRVPTHSAFRACYEIPLILSPISDIYPASSFSLSCFQWVLFPTTCTHKSLHDDKLVFWFSGVDRPWRDTSWSVRKVIWTWCMESQERLQEEREGWARPTRVCWVKPVQQQGREKSSSKRWAPMGKGAADSWCSMF